MTATTRNRSRSKPVRIKEHDFSTDVGNITIGVSADGHSPVDRPGHLYFGDRLIGMVLARRDYPVTYAGEGEKRRKMIGASHLYVVAMTQRHYDLLLDDGLTAGIPFMFRNMMRRTGFR